MMVLGKPVGTSDTSAPHVMCDIETFGTSNDAAIASIGAVRFDLDTGEVQENGSFHSKAILQGNLGTMDADTIKWWLEQSKEALEALLSEPRSLLSSTLLYFKNWLEAAPVEGFWSNGPTFDEVIVRSAFRRQCLDFPVKFWNSRCMRTYKMIAAGFGMELPKHEGTKHDALSDAIHQANVVCAIHGQLQEAVAV